MTARRSIALCLIASCAFLAAGSSWSADLKSPLPVDPKIKMGKLENGMQYWILKHATPPKKISMYLHVDSGSLNEAEDQRGLAHFLEHMAFNGSKNFPPGSLVKFFEGLGMRFGADQNAFTGFDQTTYILTLPNTEAETLEKGFTYLSDVAFRLSILEEEVDKERKVILEEARARKGVRQRMRDKLIPILLPGSRVAERMPIGKEEVVKATKADRLKAYYMKWYRPDNTTLLAVGDADPAVIEKFAAKHFATWKASKDVPKDADPGIKTYTSTRTAVITDKELTGAEVSSIRVMPMYKMETVEDYRGSLVRNIGSWVMNRRFSEMVQKGKAPFRKAYVYVTTYLNVATYAAAGASGNEDRWESMMGTMLMEVKRARVHGFLEQELADAKRAVQAEAEQAAKTEATRNARSALYGMNRSLSQGRKPMAAAQRLALVKALLPTIKLDEVTAAFRKHFADKDRLLLVEMPEKKELAQPDEAKILAAVKKAEAVDVKAKVAKKRPKSLLEKEPEPGKISKQKEDEDTKILSVTFENGVRVRLRSMDFKKNQVWVRMTLAGGELAETAANRGITEVATLALQQQASKKLSSIDIRDIMTGKNIRVGGSKGRDSLTLRISGATKDLEDGFKLAYLLLTEGRIEASALKVWRERELQAQGQRKKSLEHQLRQAFRSLLYGDDPRVKFLTKEQAESITLEAAQAWLDGLLSTAPMEVSIVGDVDRDKALALAQKYLGSLPKRTAKAGDLNKLRKQKHIKAAQSKTVEVPTITPRAVVILGWRGADLRDVKATNGMILISRILQSRLREEIRENQGLTYSIGCFNSPGMFYEDSGFLAAYLTTDPAKAPKAAQITREVMENFVLQGPTEKEWETVQKQLQVSLKDQMLKPGYWSSVLADLDYRGRKLKDVKRLREAMAEYTIKDLKKVLKKFFTDERYLQVISLPDKKVSPPKPAAEKPKAEPKK